MTDLITRPPSRFVRRFLAAGGSVEPFRSPAGRLVVVVPHPDDETLGAGGLIARHRALDREVHVVAVTDGEAAYPDWAAADLAVVRRREQVEALEHLGVGRHQLERLVLPDGRVEQHEQELVATLTDLIRPGDTVVAPATFDWHPDHEACGRAATTAAARHGCATLGTLFWAHHHPEGVAMSGFALSSLALSADEMARRCAAIDAHGSQLDPGTGTPPILDDRVRGHLELPVEWFVTTEVHG